MLTHQQINNLITGTEMAAELPASQEGLRRFLQIWPLERNENGRFVKVSPFVNRSKYETVFFKVRVYELPASYIDNGCDVTKDELTFDQDLGYIQGVTDLRVVLTKYLQDFSMLVASYKTDCPL